MADKIFHSTAVTFVDMTDSRILDVYISSNHPTVQLCNVNKTPLEYTPNWSVTNLELKASFYLDSNEITPDTIEWYTKIESTETTVGNTATLRVTSNVLGSNAIITYGCRATYQNLEAFKEITFTRVDTGLNGSDGSSAPAVQAQYSTDGSTGWTSTLNAATHKYIRHSYDGGKIWTAAIKIVGEDGTSVNIKGTATSKKQISGTSYWELVYNSATITGAVIGDAYLLDGNLYVCVDSRDGNDYFMDVGHIQGPQGNDGQSSYVFIRYATSASGANMTASPNSTTTYIGICTVNTNVAPTTASSYTWSKFVGDNAKSIILSGTSQIFKVSQDATPIYTPTTIKVTAQTVNTTVANWEYSVNGGISWTTIPAGVSLDESTNTLTITGKDLTSNSLVIRASNGIYKDIYTIYKVFDGVDGTPGNPGTPAPIAFLTNENISFSANASGQVALTSFTTNVVAYHGTTKVTPTIRTNADGTLAITGLPTGMTVAAPVTTSNEQILTFSIANNSTLGSTSSNNGTITIPIISPVSTNLILSWSKINSGATGVGIKSTTVSYGVSDSSSTQPTEWQSTIPAVAEGKYLWTRTIIDYTDEKIPDTVTYVYAKQGAKGSTGNPGSSVTVSSIQYQEGTSATTAPTGTWSNAVVSVADGKYLWTKTTFSDSKVAYGVAKQGAKGSAGAPAVAFQIYSQNGYLLTIDNPSLTLQTVAYEGSAVITSGATFKWYSLTDGAWTAISGATSNSLSVSKTDVLKSKSYKCEMTYKNNVYTSTATVEDKTDIYSSLIHATSKYSSTNRLYWVLYSIVYSEEGERDELLGPIDTAAPPSPTAGEYWYKIDETNYTVSLMKYSGTAWTTTTDKQELVYDWFLLNDVDNMITLGAQSKVKIVTANDFSRTGSVQCNVSDAELILLTQNNQILTDPSDPIISSIEPTNPINGQLWIKTNSNGSYVLLVWDSSIGQWVVSEADTQNKVYVTKPTQYKTGDLWIVDSNYQPVAYDNGVAQTYKHPEKTMLRATATSQKYSDAHWVEALKYQKELDDVVEDVGKFKKFMTIDDTGLIMQAKDVNGVVSDFKTVLTNTELGFYQGASRVAYINNNQLNISKAEITNGMTISGTTPELKIGNFVLIQESNGSLSIGLKS